jgi:hypothetical protein
VIEMSQPSWLVDRIVPGIAHHPVKKLEPDEAAPAAAAAPLLLAVDVQFDNCSCLPRTVVFLT